MPIHEYLLPDGSRVEKLFLHGESIPEEIEVDGARCPKVVSRPVVKFRGSFSGGTSSKHIVHRDDGSVVEPGREKDVQRNRQRKEEKQEEARRKHIENSLAEYAL